MAEQSRGNIKAINTKRPKNRLWIIFIVILGSVIGLLFWRIFLYKSVDEQLAAIEAARAIDDSENAAILYEKLLQNPNALIKDQSDLHGPDIMVTRNQPWTANDYPNIAAWIKEHQWLITELMKITKFEKCRFPLIIERTPTLRNRLMTMRKWAFFLCQAANNDIGESRIDDAIEKWQCLIRMGKHLRQQSRLIEYLEGMSIESMGIMRTINFLAEFNTSKSHLRKIESFQVQTHDDWLAVLDRIRPVEEIGEQKFKRQLSLIERLKYEFEFGQFTSRKANEISRGIYLRSLVNQRGMYVMIALRRYKNENGHWPEKLNSIKPWVSEEVLTDPHNNRPFVYKLTDDGFILYSKGKNNIDEGGRNKDGADDWRIWLPKTNKTQGITSNKR